MQNNIVTLAIVFILLGIVALILLGLILNNVRAFVKVNAELLNRMSISREEDNQWCEREKDFLLASQDAQMIPWSFSATCTWLVCDFVKGGQRRAVKSLDRLRISVSKFAEAERVVLSSIVPFGQYCTSDGVILYEGMCITHSPTSKRA